MDKPVKIYCPFGCSLADCDGYGYCRHLLGFTNDGKTFEPVKEQMHGIRTDKKTGYKFVDGADRQKVLRSDRLINPETPQIDNGAVHMKKEWVSSRVYRISKAELDELNKPVGEDEPTEDEMEQLTRPLPANV